METAMVVKTDESVLRTELSTIATEFFPSIVDEESCQTAIERVRKGKDFIKKVEEYFNPDIEKANALHKSLTGKRKALIDPVKVDIEFGEKEISKYRQIEVDKQKQEQERNLAEQKKQAEEAKRAAAQEAAKSGDTKKAEAILSQPTVLASVKPIEQPKNGEKQKEIWEYEVFTKLDLVKAVAEGRAPMAFLDINESELKKGVNLLKIENPYPGVRAWKTLKVSVK